MTDAAPKPEALLAVAAEAARTAGKIQRARARRPREVDHIERHDVKLGVDRLCEEAVVKTIRAAFPSHAILAEEGGDTGGDGYRWIVDPLDGTVNYYYGLPYYCTSVACYASDAGPDVGPLAGVGRPIAGAVYAAPTDELFTAVAGGGAFLNGERIRLHDVTELSEAIVCTGYGKARELCEKLADTCAALVGSVRKIRILGAAAYDLCHVADGRLSGFFEADLRTWDVAAAAIILAEAGGHFEATPLAPTRWRILGCAPGLAGPLREGIPGMK